MRAKTVLITGGTGGIGKQTARGLAAKGATTLVVGRDLDRAEAAATELRADTENPEVYALTADVSRPSELRRLAESVAGKVDRLDVLINNAAANPPRRMLTADGIETTFATNVLAPFVLGHELLPLLDGGGRIVNLTGGIPARRIEADNLQAERSFSGFTFSQYNHTKLAVMAMSLEFSGRVADRQVSVNVAYPGHASTPGNRRLPMSAFPVLYRPAAPLLRLLGPMLMGTTAAARASRSSVFLASSTEVAEVTGAYYDRHCRRVDWLAGAVGQSTRDAVWRLCERLSRHHDRAG
ncbi:MAG: SDR family NAD(P)-dependent oxidoreductase [Stackebrandtia sp.]